MSVDLGLRHDRLLREQAVEDPPGPAPTTTTSALMSLGMVDATAFLRHVVRGCIRASVQGG